MLGAKDSDGTLGRDNLREPQGGLDDLIPTAINDLRYQSQFLSLLRREWASGKRQFSNQRIVTSDLWQVRQRSYVWGEPNVYLLQDT